MQSRDRFANPILGVILIFGLMSTTPSFQAHAQIAFVSDRTGNHEIFVMDADGNNLQNLSSNTRHCTPLECRREEESCTIDTVSYTHLTLPTKRIV